MIKKKSEAELSKFRLKAKYRNFWTSWKWIPGRSPEVWTDLLNNSRNSKEAMLYVLKGAVTKLTLEKKITLEQKEELTKMLMSQDRESNYLAVTIMAQIAPKRFLRKIKYTKIKKPDIRTMEMTDGTKVMYIHHPIYDNPPLQK